MTQDENLIETRAGHHVIKWQNLPIRVTYRPQYSEGITHVEIYSGDKVPLPITQTGYKSHFFLSDTPPSINEIVEWVLDWLNKDAQSKEWQDYLIQSKQMDLFG